MNEFDMYQVNIIQNVDQPWKLLGMLKYPFSEMVKDRVH